MKNIAKSFFSFLLGGMLLLPGALSAENDLTINTNLSGLRPGGTLSIPYTLENATPGTFVAVTPVGDLVTRVTSEEIIVTSVGQTVEGAKLLVSVCDAKGSLTRVLDKDGLSEVEEYPVIIDGATRKPGTPASAVATLESKGGSVQMNPNMIAGGSNMITITSPEELETIELAVKGKDGFYSLKAADYKEEGSLSRSSSYVYKVDLRASLHIAVNVQININIFVVTIGGDRWNHDSEVEFLPTGIGDLKVSLTFSNAKDVDLWVKEPNGNFVYFGNRKPSLPSSSSKVGLDMDSNPGCSIDNRNNENIFFTEDCLQKGTYEVYVQMFENCDPSTATSWTVNAYYKGEMLQAATGVNPATGVFPVNTPSAGTTLGEPVMTFKIDEGQEAPTLRSTAIPVEANPTESAKIKLRESGLID